MLSHNTSVTDEWIDRQMTTVPTARPLFNYNWLKTKIVWTSSSKVI